MANHIPSEDDYEPSPDPYAEYPSSGDEPAGYSEVEAMQGKPFGGREVGPGHTDQTGAGYDF